MSRSRSSFDALPLFAGEPDIWNSLDEPIQEQILDSLALLLLRHIERTGAHPRTTGPLPKETQDER